MAKISFTWPRFPKSMVMAATVLLLLAAGCSSLQGNLQAALPDESTCIENENIPDKMTVPLFEHGKGYGSFNNEALVPAVFITEAEAKKLFDRVSEEFGLAFTKGKDIKIGNIKTALFLYDDFEPAATGSDRMQLSLDGYNAALGFAYEFISVDDVTVMQSYENESMVFPIPTYAFKDTALLVLNGINSEKAAPNTAVFYDPCLSYNEIVAEDKLFVMGRDKYIKAAKQANREQLEQQIRDFFEWLKGKGII